MKVLATAIREETDVKSIQIGNEELKLLLFANDMILYMKTLKTTRKQLEVINEFGKFAGYKISIQKSVAFLYTNNKPLEREIRKITSFRVVSKN